MVSNDVNAVRVILSLLPSEKWKEDMPRMVQGALARQIRGRWDLTLANAWGVLAMEKFSKTFEAVPVTGSTRVGPVDAISNRRLEYLTQGKSFSVSLACQERRSLRLPSGDRKAMADHPEPCCHSSERAFLKRVQDQEDGHSH